MVVPGWSSPAASVHQRACGRRFYSLDNGLSVIPPRVCAMNQKARLIRGGLLFTCETRTNLVPLLSLAAYG